MRRHLFNLLTVLSLLLWAAVVALWVRSYRVMDVVVFRVADGGGGYTQSGLVSFYGSVGLGSYTYPAPRTARTPTGVTWEWHDATGMRTRMRWDTPAERYGFGLDRGGQTTGPGRGWSVRVPHWLVLVALTILPAAWLRRASRTGERRRLVVGLCPACGYDLGASLGRCPECGTETPGTVRPEPLPPGQPG